MKYSLLHKFQGAYLGSCIGKLLSSNNTGNNQSLSSTLVLQDLVSNLDNDLAISKKYFFQSKDLTISDFTLDLLFWILLYHDNWYHLQHLINQVSEQNNFNCEDQELIELWVDQLILSLAEKLDIKHPVQQILSRKQLQYNLNLEHIKLIELALFQGKTSKQLLEILFSQTNDYPRIELLFSLYLFWSIAEDFSLIIKRGTAVSQKFRNTVGLVGTLAGAYNSLTGISPYWLHLYQNQHSDLIEKQSGIENTFCSEPLPDRSLTNIIPHHHQEMINDLAMIKKLFNFWSGVYDHDNNNSQSLVIAIPNSFQTRSSLKIVSQQEYRSN
ncbi:MAG: hypothetical protein QNJ60_09315 [Xenococcaceae cyanobacterium MO_188.B19]|nr:hypothetical protein [Xenococcaceae cyanobacterium MO_188.B19]